MNFDLSVTLGNLLTLVGLMASWAGGIYTLNRKAKERAQTLLEANEERARRMHEDNARRIAHVEAEVAELKGEVQAAGSQVALLVDFFRTQMERRSPRR